MRQKSGMPKPPAEKVINDIRRATHKQYDAEEKIRMVQVGGGMGLIIGLVILLVLGAVVGLLAGLVVKGSGYSMVGDIVVGILGSMQAVISHSRGV